MHWKEMQRKLAIFVKSEEGETSVYVSQPLATKLGAHAFE
jgi:hypothetical protein